jgi:hypothetical protein
MHLWSALNINVNVYRITPVFHLVAFFRSLDLGYFQYILAWLKFFVKILDALEIYLSSKKN